MRLATIALALAAAVVVTSCATGAKSARATLTPAEKAIRIVPESQITEDCSYTGIYATEHGANFSTYQENLGLAEAAVRTKAAADGATHIVVQTAEKDEDQSNWASALGGTETTCNNCVTMQVTGYKCAGAAAPSHGNWTVPTGEACGQDTDCASGRCFERVCK